MSERLLVPDMVDHVAHIAAACRRLRAPDDRVITHTALIYRDSEERLWLLHFGGPRKLLREKYRPAFGWVVPRIPPFKREDLILLADLCDLIYSRYKDSQEILYGLRFSYDVKFGTKTGELDCGQLRGVTCSTFVLAVFNSYNFQLLDLDSWEPRAEDENWQHWVAEVFRNEDPFIATDMPCLRYRPEEVVGACLETSHPVLFARGAALGASILEQLDEYLERSGLSV